LAVVGGAWLGFFVLVVVDFGGSGDVVLAVVGGAWFGFFVLGFIVEVVLVVVVVVVVVVNGVEADIVVVVNIGVVPSGSSGGRIPLPSLQPASSSPPGLVSV